MTKNLQESESVTNVGQEQLRGGALPPPLKNIHPLRDSLYSQIQQIIPEFQSLHENDKLGILPGEGHTSSLVAHIYKCHKLRGKE